MGETQQIETVISTFIGNPFARTADELRGARAALDALDVPRILARLLRQDDLSRTKELILAVGHARAQRAPNPRDVLPESMLPPSVAGSLPRPRGAYVRIAAAAGRCYQTLLGIRGTSELMNHARRDTWSACFGDSLRHALELERVIRDHDILILGETGTGKETFAHAVQMATPGADDGEPSPSSAINAAAIPESLVESELFGHVKGAFTGASDTRIGRLRSSDGGAFFLDEVGDLPFPTQVKLLRVIETNRVYPVGSDAAHSVDVRYVAATHKNLRAMVEAKEFRADLYERLAGTVLKIPPLRDRPEDIPEIGRYFVEQYLAKTTTVEAPSTIETWLKSREARTYAWPGNVRELQNALRNLMLGLSPGLTTRSAPERPTPAEVGLPPSLRDSKASLQEVSDWYMQRVLGATDNNYTQAARILGVDRSTVRRRMKALSVD